MDVGQKLSEQSSIRQDIAKSRWEIERLRLPVLAAAIFHQARFCRVADEPDEVQMSKLARMTLHQKSR